MTELLEPCPFCGGEAVVDHYQWWDSDEPPNLHDTWQIGCAKEATKEHCCLGRLCHNRGYKTESEAIAAWNRRAERIATRKGGGRMNRTDLDTSALSRMLRRMAGDGSIEWVMEPIQASVLLDMADSLDENTKLRRLAQEAIRAAKASCDTAWTCINCQSHYVKAGGCPLWQVLEHARELGIEVDDA